MDTATFPCTTLCAYVCAHVCVHVFLRTCMCEWGGVVYYQESIVLTLLVNSWTASLIGTLCARCVFNIKETVLCLVDLKFKKQFQ